MQGEPGGGKPAIIADRGGDRRGADPAAIRPVGRTRRRLAAVERVPGRGRYRVAMNAARPAASSGANCGSGESTGPTAISATTRGSLRPARGMAAAVLHDLDRRHVRVAEALEQHDVDRSEVREQPGSAGTGAAPNSCSSAKRWPPTSITSPQPASRRRCDHLPGWSMSKRSGARLTADTVRPSMVSAAMRSSTRRVSRSADPPARANAFHPSAPVPVAGGIRWMPSASSDTFAARAGLDAVALRDVRGHAEVEVAALGGDDRQRDRRRLAQAQAAHDGAGDGVLVVAARRAARAGAAGCAPAECSRRRATRPRTAVHATASSSWPDQRISVRPRSASWPTTSASKMFLRPTSRATSGDAGRASSVAGRPACSVAPRCRIDIRSASAIASSSAWVTSTIGIRSSRRSVASSSCSFSRVTWSTAEKGSSSSSTLGSRASARATATRCCWPPDSRAGRRSSRPARLVRSSSRRARSRRSAERQVAHRLHHVLLRGQVREQRVVLEHETDRAQRAPVPRCRARCRARSRRRPRSSRRAAA